MVVKLLSILVPLILLTTSGITAEDAQQRRIIDPERDYVASPHPEFGGLSSDELLRLDLDLNGEGKATVFLTTKKFGSRSGYTWTAYTPAEGNRYRRIDYTSDGNLIQFRPDLVFAGKYPGLANNGGLLILYPGKEGGSLIRYEITDGVANSYQVRALNYQRPEDKKLFEAIFKRDVEKPLPAEYFTAPPYRVLSAKEVRARSPESAPEPALVAPPSPTPPSRTATSAPAAPVPAPTVAESPARVVERKSPVWPWLVGIAALTVIAVLLFKRRV
jgi:hypothetical protein